MKKRVAQSLAAALVLSIATLASAAPVIDQDQPSGPTYIAGFSEIGLAQSFQQTHDNVAGAGILLQAGTGQAGTVTIGLWDNLPNAGGNMLASGSTIGSQGEWVDVFWSPVDVTPNTTRYLVFTSDNNGLGIAGDTANPYPLGLVYAGIGFGSWPGWDYAFRTYYDDAAAVVPVPGAVLLGLIGTGTAGYLRRRRVF